MKTRNRCKNPPGPRKDFHENIKSLQEPTWAARGLSCKQDTAARTHLGRTRMFVTTDNAARTDLGPARTHSRLNCPTLIPLPGLSKVAASVPSGPENAKSPRLP